MKYIRLFLVLLIVAAFGAIFALPKQLESHQKAQGVKIQEEAPQIYPHPKLIDFAQPAPVVSANSAVVIDAKTGAVLFEKSPDVRLFPASTSKLMTALVALKNCTPDQRVIVGLVDKEPNQMGLSTGDVVTVEALLYGMLVNSGNDAAFVLSYSCAQSTTQFVEAMNQEAKELNMLNSKFTNPSGFDDPDNFSTALDLAKLARVSVANPLIAKIVATKSTVVTDVTGNRTYYLENVNKLLGEVNGIEGIKTGQTPGSLQVLITKTTRDGNTIVAVVLGSLDRFADSKLLIEWAFANYHWQKTN